jgi:hypothetical protein
MIAATARGPTVAVDMSVGAVMAGKTAGLNRESMHVQRAGERALRPYVNQRLRLSARVFGARGSLTDFGALKGTIPRLGIMGGCGRAQGTTVLAADARSQSHVQRCTFSAWSFVPVPTHSQRSCRPSHRRPQGR